MAYQSVHTGPEVDAAVSVLSDVQDIRDEVETNLNTVTTLAGQTATNAGLAQTAATNAQADAASALTSRNEAHTSAQAAATSAAASDAARAQSVVAKNGAEQARDSAWEAEDETRALLSESGPTIDAINAELRRMKYGSGPYPSLELGFVGASMLDRRVEFTRASNATYWDELGTLQTDEPNEPRFDYDPVTGESLGLLVEGQATNLVRWSNDYSYATWTKTNVNVQASAAMAPDQTLTMCKLVEDSANSSHHISTIANYTSGQLYTVSVIAKAAERSSLSLQLSPGAFGASVTASFNLAAETALLHIPGTESSVSIKPVGSGFYLCSLTSRATATATSSFDIYAEGSPNTRIYQGDGVSGIYLWGAQSEAGSEATSRIKTEASQVTRAADLANIELGDWYNPDKGTLVIDAPNPGTSVTRGMLTIFNANVSGNIPRIQLVRNPNNITEVAVVNDAGVVDTPGLYAGSSLAPKTAIGIQDDNLAITTGGNPAAIDNTVAVPRSVTYMRIGATLSSYINGHIRGVTYYPRRLDDSKLVELTTP